MDNSSLDLASLRALEALLTEQHVSRAAQRLNLSQPAVSRALARLRDAFDDELLIRDANGYVLSARAASLIEPVRRILRELEALQRPAVFDPARSVRQFALAALDFELKLFLPRLLARMRRHAPSAGLRALSFANADFGLLDENEVDIIITAFPATAGHYRRRLVYHNDFACVMSSSLARRISGDLSLERFVELRHGLVSFETRGEGLVDTALASIGLTRRIALRVPGFLHVPDACLAGDVVFTLPRRTAAVFPRTPKLSWLPAPLDLPETRTYLLWHPRDHLDPEQQWLREQLFASAADIETAAV